MTEPDEIVMSLDHYQHLLDRIGFLERQNELLKLDVFRDKQDPGKNLSLVTD